MSVPIEELTPGTVAITLNGKIAVVTGHRPQNTKYPVLYKTGTGVTTYKGNGGDFRAVIGVADVDDFLAECEERPKERPSGFDNDLLVPEPLKGLKVGDTIEIRGRRGVERAEYRGYNPRAPKNCVNLRMRGKDYKGPLSIVVGKAGEPAKPGRSEEEIMREIMVAYCGLSPENLTCDGELPRAEVNRRRGRLRRQLQDLFKELGREVTEQEAYEATE